MEQKQVGNIHTAILNVYKKVGYVQKTGNNTFHKYRYASEADLIAALRPAMVEEGIIMYPCGISDISLESKGDSYHFKAQYAYKLVHAESDTFIITYAMGEGSDKGDKAAYKSSTGAKKYGLRETFMIETGDDPDDDEHPNNKAADKKKTKAAETAPAPQVKAPVPQVPIIKIPESLDDLMTWGAYQVSFSDYVQNVQDKVLFVTFCKANAEGMKGLRHIIDKHSPFWKADYEQLINSKKQQFGME